MRCFLVRLIFLISIGFLLLLPVSAQAQDSDGDGVVDTVDIDDDNDGVLDFDENLIDFNLIPSSSPAISGAGNGRTWTFTGINTIGGVTYDLRIEQISNRGAGNFTINNTASINFGTGWNARNGEYVILEYTLIDQATGLPRNVDAIRFVQEDIDGQRFGNTAARRNETSAFEIIGYEATEVESVSFNTNNLGFLGFLRGFARPAGFTTIRQTGNPSNASGGHNVAFEYRNVSSFRIMYGVTAAFDASFADVGNLLRNFFFGSFDGLLFADSDLDGLEDRIDLDSDNDGIPDNVEAQASNAYIPPNPDGLGTLAANDGLNTAYLAGPGLTPVNTDGTDAVDMLDLDTDNDTIFDIVESGLGLNDGNNNGRTDNAVGTNGLDNSPNAESFDDYSDVNGLSHDNVIFNLLDTDGDTGSDGTGAAPTMTDFDWRDVRSDFSDAPATFGDSIHAVIDGIRLGALIDGDPASLASADADGDGADDDGVTIPVLATGRTAAITTEVTGAGGFLQGWIDFNGDGDFDDAGEQVATDLQDDGTGGDATAADGTITFDVAVPASATLAQTFARFRWSTTSGLDAVTAAADGEVEDYAVTIAPPPFSVAVCTPTSQMRFVPLAQEDVANGLLGFAEGDTNRTYTNVLGAGIDLVLSTRYDDGNTNDADTRFDNGLNSFSVRPGGAQWTHSITAFETGTVTPAELSAFEFVLEDFETGEEFRRVVTTDAFGTPSTINIQSQADISFFSGALEFTNGGEGLNGHNSGAGSNEDKWVNIALPTGNYHQIDLMFENGNGGRLPLLGLCGTQAGEWSDAPQSYGVSRHLITEDNALILGNEIDTEYIIDVEGYPDDATGDGDDDDGITIPALTADQPATITAEVTGAGGFLQGLSLIHI